MPAHQPKKTTLAKAKLRRRNKQSEGVGYKGQRRVLERWRYELTTMRLRARARGDRLARIELEGFLAPGVMLGDGSLWMLVLGSAGRREARALFAGKAVKPAKRRRHQDGMYFGERQGNGLCLLKPRPKTRFFGARPSARR